MALVRSAKVDPRPPPIPNGQGKKTMKMTEPERAVTMDAGVFDYLWRIVEDRHQHAPAHHPEHADLLERAVGCFRRAMAPEPVKVATNGSGPRRVVKRR